MKLKWILLNRKLPNIYNCIIVFRINFIKSLTSHTIIKHGLYTPNPVARSQGCSDVNGYRFFVKNSVFLFRISNKRPRRKCPALKHAGRLNSIKYLFLYTVRFPIFPMPTIRYIVVQQTACSFPKTRNVFLRSFYPPRGRARSLTLAFRIWGKNPITLLLPGVKRAIGKKW